MSTMTPERWERTGEYLREVIGRDDDVLTALRAAAKSEGLPDIAVSSEVGRLLLLLARTTRGKTFLELGTLGGYSGVWLARGLAPGGRLTTVEIDPKHAAFARGWFERAGVADRVEVVEGAALEVLPKLTASMAPGSVDLVFLDAVKTEYPDYLRAVRDLVAPGGLLIADNALGSSVWWITDEGGESRDAVDRFNRALAADDAFDVAAVPVREGVLIARRKA